MKIKTKVITYGEFVNLKLTKPQKPKKPNLFFRTLVRLISESDLKAVNFKYETLGLDKLSKNEPVLYLMNHSSFLDLKIASKIIYPKPYNIVCTSDGFVGKQWLMHNLGCIPTKKFTTDTLLVRNIMYAVNKLKCSVLMYPEASYTFDGTATPLPASLGKCLKLLNIPVVMIFTHGAFLRDPLYNGLKLRKVNVTAEVKYIISKDDIKNKTVEELNDILKENFTFDNFREQQENKIKVSEPFIAEGLNRVLYKCPNCNSEGNMLGKGNELKCGNCNKTWILDEYGYLQSENDVIFNHIPNWYEWERKCVKEEILSNTYMLNVPVKIAAQLDNKCIYFIGEGTLQHSINGFVLSGCDGKLNIKQSPNTTYSLYSDYYWYEIGDMICICDNGILYYCFPTVKGDFVAKTRLATEEIYKKLNSDIKTKQ